MIATARGAGRRADPGGWRPIDATVDGRLIYAVGDVHGRFDLLTDLLAQIRHDATDSAAGRTPLIVFVGDYVDRGPDSARVLSVLLWLRRHAPFELALLKGNHEDMLLAFCDDPDRGRNWLTMGGEATLASYGVELPGRGAGVAMLRDTRDRLLDAMPASHLELLRTLLLVAGVGDVLFVHAGLRPGVPIEDQRPEDMMWIREEFLDDETGHEKLIVHGHSWLEDRPVVTRARIGLDTGAYDTGVLTAARIEDGALRFLQARMPPPARAGRAA